MRTTRTLVAAASLATGVLLAGCSPSSGDAGQDASPSGKPEQQNALANFDPCNALSPDQAQSFGVSPKGEPDSTAGEVGCDYEGENLIVGVRKNKDADKQYWQGQKDSFDKTSPNTVGAHDGFSGVPQTGAGQGVCRQMMYSGQGSAIVDVTLISDEIGGSDACSKATEIAKQVEPKLPA